MARWMRAVHMDLAGVFEGNDGWAQFMLVFAVARSQSTAVIA